MTCWGGPRRLIHTRSASRGAPESSPQSPPEGITKAKKRRHSSVKSPTVNHEGQKNHPEILLRCHNQAESNIFEATRTCELPLSSPADQERRHFDSAGGLPPPPLGVASDGFGAGETADPAAYLAPMTKEKCHKLPERISAISTRLYFSLKK